MTPRQVFAYRCPQCGVQQEQGAHSDQRAGVLPLTGARTAAERDEILAWRRSVAQFLTVRRQWRDGTITTSGAMERIRDLLIIGDAP